MIQTWLSADAGMVEAVSPLVRIQPAGTMQNLLKPPRGSVAIVTVQGILTAFGLDSPYRGGTGTSTAALIEQVDSLRISPDIMAVAFLIDSPGGQSMLIPEAADAIKDLAKSKPTVSIISGGWACSAAFWLASQTGKIFATRGSLIGSIGSYVAAVDSSGLHEKIGLKVVVVRSSPLKGSLTPGEPINDAVRSDLQRIVDATQSQFREALASGRKLAGERMSAVETGQVWRAAEAQKLGLIDGIVSGFDSAIASAGWTALLAGNPTKSDSRVKQPYELRAFQ